MQKKLTNRSSSPVKDTGWTLRKRRAAPLNSNVMYALDLANIKVTTSNNKKGERNGNSIVCTR